MLDITLTTLEGGGRTMGVIVERGEERGVHTVAIVSSTLHTEPTSPSHQLQINISQDFLLFVSTWRVQTERTVDFGFYLEGGGALGRGRWELRRGWNRYSQLEGCDLGIFRTKLTEERSG